MHYYKFNIGDYRRDTGHLTMLEHGAYRQLLDSYYLNEQPLPLDDAILMRTHCARNADEMQAIRNVLKDFFVCTDEGWIHNHCDRVIGDFHAKSEKAKESANTRWANKQAASRDSDSGCNADAMRPHSDGNANHKPLTKNKNKKESAKKASQLPDDFTLNETSITYAKERGVNITTELDGFRNYHAAKGSTYKDWQAAWRTWCGNSVKFGRATTPKPDDRPKLDTSLEARCAAMQAQADESYKGRAWLDGERRYRTVFKIEDGQVKSSRVYESGVAA